MTNTSLSHVRCIHLYTYILSVLSWQFSIDLDFFFTVFLFVCFGCTYCEAYVILLPRPEMEPVPLAGEAQMLNPWTTRESPQNKKLKKKRMD